MPAAKYIKVKFLKRHHRFAYAEGDVGTVKEAMLKELKLEEGKFVELVKADAPKTPKKEAPKADKGDDKK
jgi:hypothetical protein